MSGQRAHPSWLAKARADLAPFEFRAALTWRIALLCALVSAAAMMFQTPEAAISCYLIIFLMKPDAVETIGTALGLIVLVSIVVAGVVWLINATVEYPLLRLLSIALVSFIFLFIGSASQLGEIGGVIALVIAFVMTLVNLAPLGHLVTFGLREAWYMAAMPMALMAVFNLVLGLSPVSLLRSTLRARLVAVADAIRTGDTAELAELLRADNGAQDKMAGFVKVLALVGRDAAGQIGRDVRAAYALMLVARGLPADLSAERRADLAAAVEHAIKALDAGEAPPRPMPAAEDASPAEQAVRAALAVMAGAPEAPVVPAPKVPFFAPDAFSNPVHQQFALKTTAAAMICYLIYAGLSWQGIHTAMITCYVAALGTTGETVHKLGLRICGCLIGAALGLGAILFVIPHLETVAGLMVLVFAGVLVGAWVSTGPERISYGGVQIALAFLLTVLQGFGPSLDLDTARDRIIGILLGNVVIYLLFTQVWPVSLESAVRGHLKTALAALAQVAALPPALRAGAVPVLASALSETGKAGEALDLIPFEPRAIRPAPEGEAALQATCAEIEALATALFLSRADMPEIAARLQAVAGRMDTATLSTPADETPGGIPQRLDRLGAMVSA
ncbi:FUSC family protein [Xanthobacteraceae bacterium A53D]